MQSVLQNQDDSLKFRRKLFEEIYLKNRKIGADRIKIDKVINERQQTLGYQQLCDLFTAKCEDNALAHSEEYKDRFIDVCKISSINGKMNFAEM